jgi:molybdate transport system substrate-binding protein
MKKIILLLIVIAIFTGFKNPSGETIKIAVAANMQYAIQDIKSNFEKETGITVEIILGASGNLTTQIEQGAPFDVFISADTKYPAELYKKNFAADSPKIYATGLLVLWTARNDIKPAADLKILLSDAIKKIAIANPQTAPYGTAAVEAMKYYNIFEKAQLKLVFGESITQASQFISSKSADIGFTAKSVVLAPETKDKGSWIAVDTKAYHPISQAAVILKYGMENDKDAATKFYNYLYSKEAKETFKKFGYIVK